MLLLLLILLHMASVLGYMCRKHTRWVVLNDMKSIDTESTVINTLVEKGIGLVKLASPSLFMPRNATTNEGRKKEVKPLKISIVSSHVHKLALNNTVNAITYLSLPATEYSVLDSSLVSRSEECNDTFILNIPLGDISSMYSYGMSSSPRLKLDTTLSTSVEVKPEPENSRVRMRSNELYFINNNNNNTHSGAISNSSAFISEALPIWLVDNEATYKSDGTPPLEDDEKTQMTLKRKSSIQTGFEIQIEWKDRQKEVDVLDISCKVKVWFDVNVPLPEDVSSVLSLPPIRIIVAQLGSLLVKVVLRTLAPTFGDLLIRDYSMRFKNQQSLSE